MEAFSILKFILDGTVESIPSFLGGACSWFFVFYALAPRIMFSPKIKRQERTDNTFSNKYPVLYRFGIKNQSRHIPFLEKHSIFMVSIRARLSIKKGKTTSFFDIPIEGDDLEFFIPELPLQKANSYRWFVLCFHDSKSFNEIIQKSLGLEIDFSLEDLLSIEGTSLTIYISGKDQFTGQDKFFTQVYSGNCILSKKIK